VRVKITVDKSGKVTSAKYDPVNSSLTDSEHVRLAERAARQAQFSTSATQPIRNGYMTIRFELE
jgi:TonB family protein